MSSTDYRVAIYTRISSDRTGRRLGVERQEKECRALAERLGWTVVGVYEENDTSASKGRTRPHYNRMLRDCQDGVANAVIVYSVDRLTRKIAEFSRFMTWRKKHKIAFATVEGDNTETSNGRLILNIKASMAEAEAEQIAERVTRAAIQRARNGNWHGGVHPPQGYELLRSHENKIIGLRLDPARASHLREGARRLLSGESLYAVCNDWNSRGITTRDGARWVSSTLRRTLLSPHAIAKRSHKEVPGELFDTDWPALLDRDTWDRLHDLLGDPKRKFQAIDGSYAGKRAMGGGVSVCDLCGKKLVSQRHSRSGVIRLICHKQATGGCGVVTVNYPLLESFVLDMILTRLDSPEFHAALSTRPTDTTDQERALRDEMEQLDVQRKRAGQSFVLGIMTEAEAQQAVREVEERQAKISSELTSLVANLVVSEVRSVDDARKLWESADVSRRRRFVQSFVTEVRVKPWPEGRCSTLTRRKTESEQEFAERKAAHDRETARLRLDIRWRQ